VVIGAEQWYSFANLLTAMSIVATLLVGVGTILVPRVRRQRLYYRAPPATSVLAPGMRSIAGLEIHHDGRPLVDPYLLEVTLTARGRQDILSSAFHGGRPLVFDLGARIVTVLRVQCSPESSPVPKVTHEDRDLSVGPELVKPRQITTISILVDGDRPRLVCRQDVLEQVTLIPSDPPGGSFLVRLVVGLVLASVVSAVLALWAAVVLGAVAELLSVTVLVAMAVVAERRKRDQERHPGHQHRRERP